ncbi:hypothetical protein ES703_110048 [subsurface metagenome]
MKYALIHMGVFREIRKSVEGHLKFIPSKLARCGPWEYVKSEFGAMLDYLAIRNAKKIFVLTEHMRWEVGKLYNRGAVIAKPGLDPKMFRYKPNKDIKKELGLEDKMVVLNVNRLDPRKRVDLLITAFDCAITKSGSISRNFSLNPNILDMMFFPLTTSRSNPSVN